MEFERLGGKAVSRRRFLGLTGAAAGAAGLAAAGCGGGGGSNRTIVPGGASPAAAATSAASTSARAGDNQHGGTLQYTGFVVSDGIYDPHKTQAGPYYGQQALVYSRLLAYKSQYDATIGVDLAQSMPEQPDAKTVTFKLNPNAHWDQRDPLKGRPVTSADVKFSIERQNASDSSFVRAAQWADIDKMDTPDDGTITFHLKAPFAGMIDNFASVNAFIVAPELVANGRQFTKDNQMGSGPFQWVDWSEDTFASVARNGKWFGAGRPFLDGVTVVQPRDTTQVEGDLRVKKLDVASVGRPQADRLKQSIPSLQESTAGRSLFFGMRFFLPTAPFDDGRIRQALSIALDRRAMISQFFAGSGEMNPWISWPIRKWSLPQSELLTLQGYRAGADGRAQDITDAKALLAAYMSDKKLTTPPTLSLYVLDQAESALKMGSIMRDQLKANLGLTVTVYPVTNAQMGKGLLDGSYAWAAAPDNGWVDLDDWVFPYFHSTGTRNTFPLRNKAMDTLIESQRTELDAAKRQAIGYDIQRNLLVINAAVNFVSERVVSLAWPYVRQFPLDASDGYQNRFADCYLDHSDPTFRGR